MDSCPLVNVSAVRLPSWYTNRHMFGGYDLVHIVYLIVFILISLSLHEFMHAFVGYKLGDNTAYDQGRVSLNPLRHIDPVMTVALPIITILLIGAPILAAKPVPFDPRNVRYNEFGPAIIAAAGPLTNLALAAIAALVARNLTGASSVVYDLFYTFITLNVLLFVFNMIPIPPLDGSRVLYAFAPEALQRLMLQMEPYGLFVVFGLVALGFGAFVQNIGQVVLRLLGL